MKAELAARVIDTDTTAAKKEINEVHEIARRALSEVREAVQEYRSLSLQHEIESAKEGLETAGIDVRVESPDFKLPAKQEATLAMVLREATTNIIRHAAASKASVRVESDDSSVSLEVRDNGSGFNGNDGSGIDGMRTRIEALDGVFRIDADSGTVIYASLPINN